MQGFNKYYPPDYDPSYGSLNTYRGKHALGDRARKLDQGILITRFELPFNIWCGTCNNHIGMGVRYNAEKKKIGNYYSTPIYSFRCKCHLCDGWFEIQTDPKNTRYVVVSGARQKEEEWNPEEHGGFAIHDTEGSAAPVDPLAALEKTTDAEHHLVTVQVPRLESLQNVSEYYGADPYSLSKKVRKRFREEKKIEQQKQKEDDQLKGRYGLPETLNLLKDDAATRQDARKEWLRSRQQHTRDERVKRRKLLGRPISLPSSKHLGASGSTSSSSSTFNSLRTRILESTARQSNSLSRSKFSGGI